MKNKIIKFIILFVIFNVILIPFVYAEENNTTDIEKFILGETNETLETNETTIEENKTVDFNRNIKEKYNNNYLIIEDDANLLTNEEIVKLKEKMIPLTKYGHIIFKSINNNPYNDVARYSENYYKKSYSLQSGSMLIIDMDTRYVYIFNHEENSYVLTRAKSEIITDNIYRYLSNKRYYVAAETAFDQMYTVLEGGRIAQPMKYICNILVSISSGFLLVFLYILNAYSVKKAKNKEIIDGCEVKFNITNIAAKSNGIKKVYSPVSSSSGGSSFSGGGHSGGGGGGGFGGGGGHSSGGGHRF